jgi:hypothetical protein
MHVNAKEILTVTKTVTEPMQLLSRKTSAEANFPFLVGQKIPARVILTVTMILMGPMQPLSRRILAGVPLEIPVLPASWKSGAHMNNP